MIESDYKRRLVTAINQLPDAKARRVEDRHAVRVLDMVIKLPGYPMFFAEGKIIAGNLFGPTPGQYEEGMEWMRSGVCAVLIGWKSGDMYISPWVRQADMRTCMKRPFRAEKSEAQTLVNFMKETPL